MSTQEVAVTLTGAPTETLAVVAGVIATALQGAGFEAVTNTVPEGDSVPAPERVRTLLDMARETGSAIFATPIFIEEGTVELADPEDSDDDEAEPDEE